MSISSSSESARVTALRRLLGTAFADTERPADQALAEYAPDDPDYEGTQAYEVFRRLPDWRAFEPSVLVGDDGFADTALLSFLTPAGLSCFLPGFLWHALDLDAGPNNDALTDAVLFALKPPDSWDLSALDLPDVQERLAQEGLDVGRDDLITDPLRARFAAVVAGLSDRQRAVVARVLAHLDAAFERRGYGDDARRALDAFWRRWLPSEDHCIAAEDDQ